MLWFSVAQGLPFESQQEEPTGPFRDATWNLRSLARPMKEEPIKSSQHRRKPHKSCSVVWVNGANNMLGLDDLRPGRANRPVLQMRGVKFSGSRLKFAGAGAS